MTKHPENFEERMQEEATHSEPFESNTVMIPRRLSKEKIMELADRWYHNLEDKPLEGYIRVKGFLNIFERVQEKLKGFALEEARKYKGQNEKSGAIFNHNEGKRMFDYSNDALWCELKEKIKQREEFLKGIKTQVADTDTGEVINPPLVKYATDSITISFK